MLRNTRLVVCDVVGTIARERGLVRAAIARTVQDFGIDCGSADIETWRGLDTRDVLAHHLHPSTSHLVSSAYRLCEEHVVRTLLEESERSKVFDAVRSWIRDVRLEDVRVAQISTLSAQTQREILRRFDLDVDIFVSAPESPCPWEIHDIMRRLQVYDVRRVMRIGDTPCRIREARMAGCDVAVGVLNGESSESDLYASDADVVVRSITDVR